MVDLTSFIKSQLLEIIQWQDDSRDTISFLFPDEDKEIKNGAQLIVRESQVAQFVYLGQYGDTFFPGKHSLVTDNIPVLSRLKGWKYGFESPFKADVYFVNTRLFTGNKWGTANPIMMRDADFGIVRVRAYGTYDFRVVDPKVFLREVAGTDQNFRLDEFVDAMRSRLVSMFSDALGAAKIPWSASWAATANSATRSSGSSIRRSARSTASNSARSSSRTSRCRPKSSRRSTSAPRCRPSAISTTT
jgi:membrane protease subunit (stomatin/prohibitin family)